MFVENTFGVSMGPVVLVAGLGTYMVMKLNNVAFTARKVKSAWEKKGGKKANLREDEENKNCSQESSIGQHVQ